MKSIIFLLISIFPTTIFAGYSGDIVSVLQLSTSGKTIVLNKGINHKISMTDYGVLLSKSFNEEHKREVYRPIARIRVVKAFRETSIWIISKDYFSNLIQKNSKFLLLSQDKLLSGRSSFKVHRSKLVLHKKEKRKALTDSLREDASTLQTKTSSYVGSDINHQKFGSANPDVTLIDIEQWDDSYSDNKLKRTSILKSERAADFVSKYKISTFEKMVASFVNKYNDPRFTYGRMYEEQKKDDTTGLFSDKTLGDTFSNRVAREEADRRKREKIILENLKSRGEAWSDDFSDEELSELVYNLGSIAERDRRSTMLSYRMSSQIYTSFAINMVDNENVADTTTTEGSKFDYELSWEAYLLRNYKPFRRWSLELSLRSSQDAYSIGVVNAKSQELSFASQINWYPFTYPNALKTNIVYIGVNFRYGVSTLKSDETGERGNYAVAGFPGIKLGVKYNFENGFGIRLTSGFEQLSAQRIVKSDITGELPESAEYIDVKTGLGLSKYF